MKYRLLPLYVVLALAVSVSTTFAQNPPPPPPPPDSIKQDSLLKKLQADSLAKLLQQDSLLKKLQADSLAILVQQDSARRALLQADSARLARERYIRDSIRAFRTADSIKAPLAKFASPPDYETSSRLRFDRHEILSSGALYLTDLLERVPGVTGFRSGWLTGVHTTAYRGDFSRVRIFVDGIELDGTGPREHGVVDEVMLPLWTLETIEIERTASEVRVWCRTISPDRTTPYSRVDILTGDLNTNAFRGIFMRRFGNDAAFQLGGHQLSTQRGRAVGSGTGSGGQAGSGGSTGDGDQQVYSARLGWARKKWSIDGFAVTTSLHRDITAALEGYKSLPVFDGGRREAYVRAAWGDQSAGPWLLAMQGYSRARVGGVETSGSSGTESTTPDTVFNGTQTVLGGGFSRGALSVSVIDRFRSTDSASGHSPVLRADWETGALSAGVYLERTSYDSTKRGELFVRARPTSWSVFTVSQSVRRPDDSTAFVNEGGTLAEGALRFRGRWAGAGIMRTGESITASPVMLGAAQTDLIIPATIGALFSLRGPVYKAVSVDMQGVMFNRTAFGRPKTRFYTELRLATNWLSRFPRGEFSVDARLRHEMRSAVPFYYGTDEAGESIVRSTESKQLLNAMLEIRIQQATLFYQFRNLTGAAYTQIPGIVMPPTVQMYGVRWEFWN